MNDFLGTFLNMLFLALDISIFGRIIMSFIDPQGQMAITRVLHEVTEPILGPLRRVIPSIGMFDFSPMIALLLINFLQSLVASQI